MGDPLTIGAIAAVVGSAVSGATAIKSAHDQKKAARNAAQAAERASDTAAVTSTSEGAETGTSEQIAEKNVQGQARRRYTVQDTVRNFNQVTGLRKTLN